MRALVGAIITAGALIGLGLTAQGIGTRYQRVPHATDAKELWVRFRDMDSALIFTVVFLTLLALVGLGLALLGLAYHHERRHHERLHAERMHGLGQTPGTHATV
jgi:hypothetical protein